MLEGFKRYPEAQLVAISDFQRSELEGFDDVPVIHNGIDADAFPFSAKRGEHLAFLGRMIPSKGAAEAVRVARELGIPLIMAGPSTDWFEREVRPEIDDRLIRYVGVVDTEDGAALDNLDTGEHDAEGRLLLVMTFAGAVLPPATRT